MKKTLLLSLLAIFQLTATQFSNAQNVNRCGVIEHDQWLQSQNPKRASQRERFDQTVNSYAEQLLSSKTTLPNITIPVVVHLVYKTNAQNITDAQILSQIDVLNQDFNRLNPDTANTPAPFKPIAGPSGLSHSIAA